MDADEGQSILEVILFLPFLFILVGLLIRMNTGIQMAINNARYARAQLFVLTNNSSEYPRLQLRKNRLVKNAHDMLVVGVSDPLAIEEAASDGDMPAIPQIQSIANKKANGSQERGEVKSRTDIRIRGTAAICTQSNSVTKGTGIDSYQITALANQRWPFGKMTCQYDGSWIGDQ
jgi:hypothetical protein